MTARKQTIQASPLSIALPILAFLGLTGCAEADPSVDVRALFATDPRVFQPQPGPTNLVQLGEILFYEKRLSRDGSRGCASCHESTRIGHNAVVATGRGKPRPRNTPTVMDAARLWILGWEGTVDSLEEMIERALRDPARIGLPDEASLRAAIVHVDEGVPAAERLTTRFAQVFGRSGEPVRRAHYVRAIAAFLRTLRSEGRWDRYVEGDPNALSARERRGLHEFVTVGCATCHGSRLLGGRSTHRLGVAAPFPTDDPGRFATTGQEHDRHVFRAPPLRLVAHTAPYFHDGSVATLRRAIRVMAEIELGTQLSDDQVESIEAFLRAAGDIDATTRKKPQSYPQGKPGR